MQDTNIYRVIIAVDKEISNGKWSTAFYSINAYATELEAHAFWLYLKQCERDYHAKYKAGHREIA